MWGSADIITSTILLTDTKECDSNPCVNGATCNDEVNAYNCTCMEGYTGHDCETGMCDYKYASPSSDNTF